MRAEPDGPPLALLAPKQATFQLERQLLSSSGAAGYSRLHILSFDRLANFILDALGVPPLRLISEDGRQMVLQALLARRRADLRIFRASSGLAGFARQLSLELRELQRRQITPERLRQLSGETGLAESLRHKLHDLALLLGDYLQWLENHRNQDADQLLDLAAAALARAPGLRLFSAVWMDGFAEMTPQELDLLASIAPRCGRLTLAFCLEDVPGAANGSWLSIWSGVARTFEQCHRRMLALSPKAAVTVEVLRRGAQPGRFDDSPALRHLEKSWTAPAPMCPPPEGLAANVRLVSCASPLEEAAFAAREILRFVRAGGRFRESAVLVRRLEGYHDAIRQVFSRYEIPFFLDRRECVAQHPAAELTRSVLRAAAWGWRSEDWFAALKTGLVTRAEESVDRLENEALKRGWQGEIWFQGLPADQSGSDWAERLRAEWTPPFARFRAQFSSVKYKPSGVQLAGAIRRLWVDLQVEETLREWAAGDPDAAVHATVWEQLALWCDNIGMAFGAEAMPLREWLPILESGLAGLTVGLIPPAIDQVLVGAIDRSRNPELQLTLVLGVNETVFPAAPAAGGLLSELDREELSSLGIQPGPRRRDLLVRERFFGYIACTRSRRAVILTAAQRDASDQPLNPSPFFAHLRQCFPGLEIESFAGAGERDAIHPSELAALYARSGGRGARLRELFASPGMEHWRQALALPILDDAPLPPELAASLYGSPLGTSVSRLEEYAACAFRFFVRSGLRAEERKQFEADARERGMFQHTVLRRFHEELRAEGKRWRDLTPAEGRRRVARIVKQTLPEFHEGLLAADARSAFTARALGGLLQDFIAATIEWMAHYRFDPCAVELGFGIPESPLPAWQVDLGGGHSLQFRGVIDRVDLCATEEGETALAVVIDYKSSQHKLDKLKMEHGLQLQLAAYLSVLRHLEDVKPIFGVSRIVPAGVFYVNLRGQGERALSRSEVFREREEFQRRRFQHLGRFDFDCHPHLDASPERASGQFKVKIRLDGQPFATGSDALGAAEFGRLLDQVESELHRMGCEIYAGVIERNPYQKGGERACARCEYLSICRFDSWEKSYRVLKPARK